MEQIWKGEKIVPVSVVLAGPNTVTQIKTKEKDGYEAVQIGFDSTKKHLTKALKGHLKDLGNFRHLKEFRVATGELKVGDVIDLTSFKEGEKVDVAGNDRGRGFQGVVKRHRFGGGPKSHGQKNRLRAPGSIGATGPQRVIKGRKMAGHMGMERKTIKGLQIVQVDSENGLLYIKGALPGMRNTIVEIKTRN